MTKYREILRLTALGLSQRDICSSAGVSQKTVSKVQKRARELHLEWPLDESMTDIALGSLEDIVDRPFGSIAASCNVRL